MKDSFLATELSRITVSSAPGTEYLSENELKYSVPGFYILLYG